MIAVGLFFLYLGIKHKMWSRCCSSSSVSVFLSAIFRSTTECRLASTKKVGAQLPLLRGKTHLSAADFFSYRSDDRLFGPHIESEADDDRCSGAARYFRCIRRVARFRIYGGRGRCDRHHRRCRRPHSHLPFERLAPDMMGSIAIAAYSYMALVPVLQPWINEVVHNQKGASYPDAAAQAHLQERENHVPDNRSSAHLFPRSLRSAPARHALSGKPVEGERRYQTSCHDGRGIRHRYRDDTHRIDRGCFDTGHDFPARRSRCSFSQSVRLRSSSPLSAESCSSSSSTCSSRGNKINPLIGNAAFRQCPMRLAFRRDRVEETTITITCSCTPWGRMWPA